jgi:hypothetical protein
MGKQQEDVKFEPRPLTRRPLATPAPKKKRRQRKPPPLQPSLMQPRTVTAQQLGTSVQSVIRLEITEDNPDGLLHVYRLSGRPTGRVSHDCEEVKAVRQRLAAAQGLPLPEGAGDAE